MRDYYGTEDSYIHLKFGKALKCYHFTQEFQQKYPDFVKSYENYWNDTPSEDDDANFYNAFDVVRKAKEIGLPADFFYFNFTDTPATSYEEIEEYLNNEN